MGTFYQKLGDYHAEGAHETVLLVEDEKGELFGAFANQPWEETDAFYGDA